MDQTNTEDKKFKNNNTTKIIDENNNMTVQE